MKIITILLILTNYIFGNTMQGMVYDIFYRPTIEKFEKYLKLSSIDISVQNNCKVKGNDFFSENMFYPIIENQNYFLILDIKKMIYPNNIDSITFQPMNLKYVNSDKYNETSENIFEKIDNGKIKLPMSLNDLESIYSNEVKDLEIDNISFKSFFGLKEWSFFYLNKFDLEEEKLKCQNNIEKELKEKSKKDFFTLFIYVTILGLIIWGIKKIIFFLKRVNYPHKNIEKENIEKENIEKENIEKENIEKENIEKENIENHNINCSKESNVKIVEKIESIQYNKNNYSFYYILAAVIFSLIVQIYKLKIDQHLENVPITIYLFEFVSKVPADFFNHILGFTIGHLILVCIIIVFIWILNFLRSKKYENMALHFLILTIISSFFYFYKG